MSKTKYCKVVVYGPAQSGKTKLLTTLTNPNEKYTSDYTPTDGVTYFSRTHQKTHYYLWDTSGQPRFQNLIDSYARGCNIGLICVDLSSPLNHEYIKHSIENIKKHSQNGNIPIILVWTKSDKKQSVTDEERQALNTNGDYNFAKVHTVSTKNNIGVAELLDSIASLTTEIKSDWDKALDLLDKNSSLYEQVKLLDDHLYTLPEAKSLLVETTTLKFIIDLKKAQDVQQQAKIIADFEKEATSHLGGTYPTVGAIIVGLVITAVITVIAAAIGFGIGFAAGLWTGPGAFISGVLAGSAAAVATVGVSASFGVGLGFFGAFVSHKGAMHQNNPVYHVADAARTDYLQSQS